MLGQSTIVLYHTEANGCIFFWLAVFIAKLNNRYFCFFLFCSFGVDMKNYQTGLILLKMHQCGLARQRTFAAKNGEPRTNGLSNWTRLGCWPLITPSMNQGGKNCTILTADTASKVRSNTAKYLLLRSKSTQKDQIEKKRQHYTIRIVRILILK